MHRNKGQEMDNTIKQKRKIRWKEVDEIINRIEERKAKGEEPCQFPLETYIEFYFNPKRIQK